MRAMRNMLMVAAMAALMATTLSALAEPNENCAVRIDAGKNTNEQFLANP